ncbi:MAG: hypothetical protein ACI3VB_05285 [Oscillospiraceae bacterium]
METMDNAPETAPEMRNLNDVADIMLGFYTADKAPLKRGEVTDEFTGQELEDQFEKIVLEVETLIENTVDKDRFKNKRDEIMSSVERIMTLCVEKAFVCACDVCGVELGDIFPGEE